MSWKPPERPRWAHRLNAHGSAVGGDSHLVSLDADDLLDTARASTGLDDFGDDDWREPYAVLVRSLNEEAGLHPLGRLQVRTHLLISLRARLELSALWKRHPEILDEAIEQPTFIVGSPRTGTSILHELMNCDPATRAPAMWEMWYPADAARGEDRAALCDETVQFWHDAQPEYETMHANSGYLPNECIMILQHAFLSDWWGGNYVVPSYEKYLTRQDPTPAYRYHRRVLQTLQSRSGKVQRWLLKAPSHLFYLRTLFAVYPDARIIRTHRDPLKSLPSSINLMGTLRWIHCRTVDMDAASERMPVGYAMLYRMEMEQRASGVLPDARFFDVHFRRVVDAPADTVRKVYEQLGWPFDDATAAAITRYAAEKPQGSRGIHRYSLAEVGLDAEQERERFRFYTDHYGIEPEPAR